MKSTNNLKIGLRKQSSNSSQGPSIFLQYFRDAVLKENLASIYPYYFPQNDISIFASVAPLFRTNPYILRLDGIYFNKGRDSSYNDSLNKPIIRSYNSAAGLIFQSMFSKKLIEAHWGERGISKTVILNGTVINNFPIDSLLEIRSRNKRKVIICSGNWRTHKRLDAIIETVKNLRNFIDCELVIAGDINQKIPDQEYIQAIGRVDHIKLFELLTTGNVFIHLCLLDFCPNSVVEAIANKLPVLCSNLGGTRELVESTNAGIVSICDEKINYRKQVDLENPPMPDIQKITDDILQIFENEDSLVRQINTNPININNTAKAYIDFARIVAGFNSNSTSQLGIIVKNPDEHMKILEEWQNTLAKNDGIFLSWKQIMPDIATYIYMDRGSLVIIMIMLVILVQFTMFSTILMSVLERKREFASLLAIGTKHVELNFQIFFETLIFGLIACPIGSLLGVGALKWVEGYDISKLVNANPEDMSIGGFAMDPIIAPFFSTSLILQISIIIFLLIMILGILPMFLVSRISIVDELRA